MYKKEIEGWLKHYDFILLDLICLQIAFELAYIFSGHGINPYYQILYRNMDLFLTLADVIVIFSLGTLKGVLKRGRHRELKMTAQHVFVLFTLSLLYLFVLQQGVSYSRRALFLAFIFYALLTYSTRELWKQMLRKKRRTGGERSLLIITASDIALSVIENMKANSYTGYTLAGVVLIDEERESGQGEAFSPNEKSIGEIPLVADRATAAEYICHEWIDEVLLVPSEDADFPQKLLDKLQETGVTIHLNLSKVSDEPGRKRFVEHIGGYTVLTTSINYASAKQLFLKRVMDIVGGFVGCIITGILFLFVAPAIYIRSPGPVFFVQERVGKNGKKFRMYKFRSMCLDAEERKVELMKDNKMQDGKMFKLEFDPRVIGNRILPDGTRKTGLGQFLRDTSLDEFPQFFNVLKGDMSLVGTRPPLVGEVSEYELHHRARLSIKPGITGLWQVSGRSEITDFEEVVQLDRKYISEWSLWLDLRILFKTVFVVLKRKGST